MSRSLLAVFLVLPTLALAEAPTIPSVLHGSDRRVERCVKTALQANPSMTGGVAVELSIVEGKVTEVSVGANTTNDAELGSCVARAVRSLRFGDEVTAQVEYPIAVSGP